MSDIFSTLVKRDVAALNALIKKKVDVNEQGAGEQTPLHLASELAASDCVTALLKAGADLKAEDGQLRTPLLVASESGSIACAKLLIDAGAPLGARDKSDMTPLHWLAFHGESSLLQTALAKGAEIDAVNYALQTPLWFAITKGHVACAIALIDAGASAVAEDDEKRSMMHLAMQFADASGGEKDAPPECANALALLTRLLKAPKVDVNVVDREKRAPLHWASGKNALPCVAALLQAGADVNARDWAEHTPMHWACPMDAVDCARALAQAGAKVDAVDRDKRTPLHWAADKDAERCVRLLLEENGAEVDAIDWNGFSALHSASRRGATACIKLLLDKGANRQLVAASSETPADVAADDATRQLIEGSAGMKRRRSLSSSNSAVLESTLPTLAEKFYNAAAAANYGALKKLCTADAGKPTAAQLASALKVGLEVGTMHVCSRTCSIFVDLTLGGAPAVQHLTFNDEGLVSASRVFKQL